MDVTVDAETFVGGFDRFDSGLVDFDSFAVAVDSVGLDASAEFAELVVPPDELVASDESFDESCVDVGSAAAVPAPARIAVPRPNVIAHATTPAIRFADTAT